MSSKNEKSKFNTKIMRQNRECGVPKSKKQQWIHLWIEQGLSSGGWEERKKNWTKWAMIWNLCLDLQWGNIENTHTAYIQQTTVLSFIPFRLVGRSLAHISSARKTNAFPNNKEHKVHIHATHTHISSFLLHFFSLNNNRIETEAK